MTVAPEQAGALPQSGGLSQHRQQPCDRPTAPPGGKARTHGPSEAPAATPAGTRLRPGPKSFCRVRHPEARQARVLTKARRDASPSTSRGCRSYSGRASTAKIQRGLSSRARQSAIMGSGPRRAGRLAIGHPKISLPETCPCDHKIATPIRDDRQPLDRPSLGGFRLGTKTPCTAHRIDQPSPNFGRSAERPSLI